MTAVYTQGRPLRRAFSLMNGNALSHFRLRASSWAMAVTNLTVGIFMTINPRMLTENPGSEIYFAHLIHYLSPDWWRMIFVVSGATRLAALYVNGTFPTIWWTPHLRFIMSFISFAVWVQFAISLSSSGVLTIGMILYWDAVLVELFNIAVAASETRHGRG